MIEDMVINNSIKAILKCVWVNKTQFISNGDILYVVLNVLRHVGHYRTTLKGIVWDGIIRVLLFLSGSC